MDSCGPQPGFCQLQAEIVATFSIFFGFLPSLICSWATVELAEDLALQAHVLKFSNSSAACTLKVWALSRWLADLLCFSDQSCQDEPE